MSKPNLAKFLEKLHKQWAERLRYNVQKWLSSATNTPAWIRTTGDDPLHTFAKANMMLGSGAIGCSSAEKLGDPVEEVIISRNFLIKASVCATFFLLESRMISWRAPWSISTLNKLVQVI